MNRLFRYELRKLCSIRKLLVGLVVILLITIMMLMSNLAPAYSYDEKGNQLDGMAAIQQNITTEHALAGDLDEARLSQIIAYHNKLMADPNNVGPDGTLTMDAFYKYWNPYMNIDLLLSQAFAPGGQYNQKLINGLTPADAKKFYDARITQVTDYLANGFSEPLPKAQQDYFINCAKSITTPFYYDYDEGWKDIFTNWSLFMAFVIVLACVAIAPIFSNERHTHVDMLLFSAMHGRRKVFFYKTGAALLLSTGIFLLSVLLFTGSTLLVFGSYGWNVSLQMIRYLAPYNLNLLQVYLIIVGDGYLAFITTIAATLLVSSLVKSNFSAIILALAVYFIPTVIPIVGANSINLLVGLFPSRMMDVYASIRGYNAYTIGGAVIPQHVLYPILAVIGILILLWITYMVHSRRQTRETS